MKASKKKRGFVGAIALAGVFAVGGYALTNTITYDDASSLSGAGTQPVQVLQITDTDYTLDTTDKSRFDAIIFTVAPAIRVFNTDAKAWVKINGTAAWIACADPADNSTTVTCTFVDEPLTNVGSGGTNVQLVLSE